MQTMVIGRCNVSILRRVTIGLVAGSVLLTMGTGEVSAQGLAAVPNTMAPIYMNNTIGLVGISAARQAAQAYERRRTQAPKIVQPQSPSSRSRPTPPIARNAPPARWNYSIAADREISEAARNEYFRRLRSQMSATAARNMEAAYARRPLRQAFMEIARPLGLNDRDLRDVMAAYLITGWMISNQAPQPTAAQIAGIRKQVDGIFAGMSPVTDAGQRQIIGEVIIYGIVGQKYARDEILARGDGADLAKFTEKMADRYKDDGYDFRNLTLDNKGFHHRK